MGTDTSGRRAVKDQLARQRAVRSALVRDLPRSNSDRGASQAETAAIREFLAGGPCPEIYRRACDLCRRQLGLPGGRGRD